MLYGKLNNVNYVMTEDGFSGVYLSLELEEGGGAKAFGRRWVGSRGGIRSVGEKIKF